MNLRCPYCGSDRVHPVVNTYRGTEGFFCLSCEMEWGEEAQAISEIKEEQAGGSNKKA